MDSTIDGSDTTRWYADRGAARRRQRSWPLERERCEERSDDVSDDVSDGEREGPGSLARPTE